MLAHRNTQTTLLLDSTWMPACVYIAKTAFGKFLNDRIKGVDANGNTFHFDDWFAGNGVTHFDDAPYLTSAKQTWFLPSIAIVNEKYYKEFKVGEMDFNSLCIWYDYICQDCKKRFKKKDLSIDHVDPQHLHGTNFTNNLTLLCKRCNSKKGHKSPHRDVEGKILTGTKPPANFMAIEDSNMRPEWRRFIVNKKGATLVT